MLFLFFLSSPSLPPLALSQALERREYEFAKKSVEMESKMEMMSRRVRDLELSVKIYTQVERGERRERRNK